VHKIGKDAAGVWDGKGTSMSQLHRLGIVSLISKDLYMKEGIIEAAGFALSKSQRGASHG